MLELYEGKLSRTVLRRGNGGNSDSLSRREGSKMPDTIPGPWRKPGLGSLLALNRQAIFMRPLPELQRPLWRRVFRIS